MSSYDSGGRLFLMSSYHSYSQSSLRRAICADRWQYGTSGIWNRNSRVQKVGDNNQVLGLDNPKKG